MVTAYATWDFGGQPGSRPARRPRLHRRRELRAGRERRRGPQRPGRPRTRPTARPWETFGGIPTPFAGLYSATGSTAALVEPNLRSLGQASGLLTGLGLTPSVPVTNLGQYGYALNVGTSPPALVAAQAHLGRGITAPVRSAAGTAPAR